MTNLKIIYNPYLVKTEIYIDAKLIDPSKSHLAYVNEQRLQQWIEPHSLAKWKGFFQELREDIGDSEISVDFVGTKLDFEDLVYAKDKYGKCFERIELVHSNAKEAEDLDPNDKIEELKELYNELQNGPIDEFKTGDIRKNFESALDSDFKIVVIAPMSSGKSTLINAILGQDLLPALNQATTAVITEIRDVDGMQEFTVSATDENGEVIVQKKTATKDIIKELNSSKDSTTSRIQIEGDIPNLSSRELNTVFVDTPGGNNSQNVQHEALMDEAINDENKSLILYVFNGEQLGTNDSDIILNKIARAMEKNNNGKQSKDRFLFVANRADSFDTEKESYEDAIKNTILPQLESKGITEPNLFLVSAKTAKLIRMKNAGLELSESDDDEIDSLVKKFNRQTRMLAKYASISESTKQKFIADATDASNKAKESDSLKEIQALKYKAAEINSGVPAVEYAIREYLDKYAIAIKIKSVHDTFMKKVEERNMIDNCKAEWAKTIENFDKLKVELAEKKKKLEDKTKLKEFKHKVDEIKFNKQPILNNKIEIIAKLDDLYKTQESKVRADIANSIINKFRIELEEIGKEAEKELDNILNNNVMVSCNKIIEEYRKYLQELDDDGLFKIGSLNIKKVAKYDSFKIENADDLIEQYTSTEKVKVDTIRVKDYGVGGFFKRLFSFGRCGYHYKDIYEDQEFVNIKELVQSEIKKIQKEFERNINGEIEKTEEKVEDIKFYTKKKLDGIDKMIKEITNEIDLMTLNYDKLQNEVKENKQKAKWCEEFINKVDDLLQIGG